ncbi:MAG TPA: hypothetical protein VLJ18_09000 [Thermoanaerobaculia bacterium]|nr:hypothetical protein [Thermoanaerobaculia bacterium]
MPRPFGRDRLAGAKGGKLLLSCEESKGWRARSDATATSAEHPGTCVRWEDELFEVEDFEPRADGGVTYALRPWDERHAIRVVATYSPETEAARSAEWRDTRRRVGGRAGILLLAPLLGCLPAHVQERLENEYNVKASWMSLASALPLFMFGAFCFIAARAASFGGGPPLLPDRVLLVGQYLWVESALRIGIASVQGRGIGNVAGTALYEIWHLARRGLDRARGRPVPREKSFFDVVPADSRVEDFDRFHLLEPALSFLEPDEQASLEDRFGFDGLKWGRISAIFLLIAVGPLALSAFFGYLLVPQASDLLLLASAGGLSIEQVLRLRKVARRKPAPSILGVLVRPAARRLLDRTPLE